MMSTTRPSSELGSPKSAEESPVSKKRKPSLLHDLATKPKYFCPPTPVARSSHKSSNFTPISINTSRTRISLPDTLFSSELFAAEPLVTIPLLSSAVPKVDNLTISSFPKYSLVNAPRPISSISYSYTFPTLEQMAFCEYHPRELEECAPFFNLARNYIYSFDQLNILKKNSESNNIFRAVMRVDMNIVIALEGYPSPTVPSHCQMTEDNLYCIAASMISIQEVEATDKSAEKVNEITVISNQAGFFPGPFVHQQFLLIGITQTQLYKSGGCRFAEKVLCKDEDSGNQYYVTREELLADILRLTELYKNTLLSPSAVASYAKKFLKLEVIEDVLPTDALGGTIKEYTGEDPSLFSMSACSSNFRFSPIKSAPPTPRKVTPIKSAHNSATSPSQFSLASMFASPSRATDSTSLEAAGVLRKKLNFVVTSPEKSQVGEASTALSLPAAPKFNR